MRTIEIDNLILVEVPKDAKIIAIVSNGIEYITDNTYVAQYIDFNNRINEIIGLIETPNVDFDLEVDESWVESSHHYFGMFKNYIIESTNSHRRSQCFDKKQSFRTRIQRKIQDNGFYLVNPISINGQTFSNEHKNEWEQAEERTIKGNLLLIKKLK